MLINEKWKNSGINSKSYNSFDSVNSDYRIISKTICLSFRANKKNSDKTSVTFWNIQTKDQNVRNAYTMESKLKMNQILLTSSAIISSLHITRQLKCTYHWNIKSKYILGNRLKLQKKEKAWKNTLLCCRRISLTLRLINLNSDNEIWE